MANRLASIFRPPQTFGGSDPYLAQQAADPESAANTALSQFGLSLPTNPNPYLLFGNQPGSFGAEHQKWATGLDNIAGTLASMGPASPNIGDNISNVARGILGNRAMHQQYLQQQYQQPFAIAQQLGALQQQEDAHNLSQAHARYYDGRATIEHDEASYGSPLALSDGRAMVIDKKTGMGKLVTLENAPVKTLAGANSERLDKRSRTRMGGTLSGYIANVEDSLGRDLTPEEQLTHTRKYRDSWLKKAGKGAGSSEWKTSEIIRLEFAKNKALQEAEEDFSDNRSRMDGSMNPYYNNTDALEKRKGQVQADYEQTIGMINQAQHGAAPSKGGSSKQKTSSGNWNPVTGRYE